MKKFICGLLVGIILTMGVTVSAVPEIKSAVFSPDIKLVVNGKTLDTQIVSVVKSGEVNMTNYVSARALAESLGATVTWDGKERAINVLMEVEAASSASAPEVKSASTEANIVTAPKLNPDIPYPVYKIDDTGLIVYNIQGGKFYGLFGPDVINAIKAKGLIMNDSADGSTKQIVKDGEGILVQGITFRPYGGKGYLDYGLFVEKIQPLLQ